MVRWLAQFVAVVFVVWGIVHTGRKAAEQLADQQQQLRQRAGELEFQAATAEPSARPPLLKQAEQLRERAATYWHAAPSWLLLAGLAYTLGMIPAGLFWRTCLRRLDQPAQVMTTLYAYFLGHLGKYFPGKAMVIILRLAVLAPHGVLKVATTLTIFLETLTMMAVGSAAATLSLLCLGLDWRWIADLCTHASAHTSPGIEAHSTQRVWRIDEQMAWANRLGLARPWLGGTVRYLDVLWGQSVLRFESQSFG
jgi:hypothetical protein